MIPHASEIVCYLPAGGRRLVRRMNGYKYTIVSGEVIFVNGEAPARCRGN
jgi:hypothetical protein